jgi:hypothetical protein
LGWVIITNFLVHFPHLTDLSVVLQFEGELLGEGPFALPKGG